MSDDVIDFLADLVRAPSPDPPGNELAVARLVHDRMDRLGLAPAWDEFAPGRVNVVGRVPGRGERPPLVYSAHLDTVPVGDRPWSFDAFGGDVVGSRIRGRGTSDMKGAVAAFISAAHRLTHRSTPLSGDVILAFTAGESANCLGARRLRDQGFQSEIGAFLCGEPSTLDIIVAEKAILWLDAIAEGEIGHISGAPGINAIDLMVVFLSRLKELELDLPAHPMLSPPSITVGRISGGAAVNVTPDLCRAEIDVRFGPRIAVDTVLDQIRPILPKGVRLTVSDFKSAIVEAPDSPFVKACASAVEAVTGSTPKTLGVPYYSDGAILMEGIDAPFAIVGPGDLGGSGQPDESADIQRIRDASEIYVRIAEDWLGG